MIALLCFFLTLLVWPFKSKSRLEAENVALRRQLIILRRKVRGRVHLTNGDRLCVNAIRPCFMLLGGAAAGSVTLAIPNGTTARKSAARASVIVDRAAISNDQSDRRNSSIACRSA